MRAASTAVNKMSAKSQGATKQGNSLGAPRKLSLTIPANEPMFLPDGDSVTAHNNTTTSSTHTSPTVASNSPIDNLKNGSSRPSKEGMLDKFKQPPVAKPHSNGATPETAAATKPSGPLDLEAIMSCILGMKRLSTTIYSTFETFEKQTARVAGLAPAVDAAGQLQSLRDAFETKQQERTKRVAELRSRFEEAVPRLIDEYRSKVDDLVKEVVAEEIKDRVQRELENQLPEKLRKDVVQHERQLIEVQANLYNNEARRFNASLVSPQSLTVPLRPLLRPLPTPEQSPSYVRSPIFSPETAVPAVPLPTPMTAAPASFSGPRSSLVPPTPSALFPKDLQTLLRYDAQRARQLLADYGLIEETSESPSGSEVPPSGSKSLQTPATTPSTVKAKKENKDAKKDGKKGKDPAPEEVSDGTREADLTKFMAHIGVPMKMVPNPCLKSAAKPGRPSLRVIITGPSL
ncbi:hypothetical protein PC9H_007384 [Pleurotus ostreatus]|uniref:Uncharacterized protein n=1 Tax=Pleurotus ostreatus TaxID=5322 RepID=A0A8H7DU71_PLEOS|nr:uncharacterized protein PC9H_007384 [Pleurotus ostreatus]KAF7428163.1 hypothetical protein PC9H_007384 [Pleurotus ostreatus]